MRNKLSRPLPICPILCVTEVGVRNHHLTECRAGLFITEEKGGTGIQSSPYGSCLWVTWKVGRGQEPDSVLLTQRPKRSRDQFSTDGTASPRMSA